MSKGIDIPIDSAITDMNSRLWIGKINQFYGRVHRNELNGKIQPLFYVGSEAVDAMKDDRKDAQCFFDVLPNGDVIGTLEKHVVRVMFMVNLSVLYPTLGRNEAEETAKKEVSDILSSTFDSIYGFVSGIASFADYDYIDINISDLSPHFLFRYDCTSFNTNC